MPRSWLVERCPERVRGSGRGYFNTPAARTDSELLRCFIYPRAASISAPSLLLYHGEECSALRHLSCCMRLLSWVAAWKSQ